MKPINKLETFLLCVVVFSNLALANPPNKTEKPGVIVADPKEAPQQQNQNQSDSKTISKDAVKLFIKQVEIYGRIAKPQAVFIIPGTDPRVDGLKIDRQFFDLIFRNVEKSSLKSERKRAAKDKDFIQW